MNVRTFLIFVLIWDFCNCSISNNRLSFKKNIRVFLCGQSLEKAYLSNIKLAKCDSNSIVKDLFGLAKSACDKSFNDRTSNNEIIAFNIIDSAVKHFVKRINARFVKFHAEEVPILIFGGILNAGGDFLKSLIQQNLSKINEKRIKVIYSEMGDERAVLGAVVNGFSKLELNDQNEYAVGIDIGGTYVRIGVVKLSNFSLEKELFKAPVFESEIDKLKMCQLSSKIKINLKKMKYKKDFAEQDLQHFLNNQILCREHDDLSRLLIERLCKYILNIQKDYKLKFVAVSSAGTIGDNGFIKYAFNVPFTCVNLQKELEHRVNIPVIVENDIFCAALGEKLFGKLKNYDEFIIAGLGTGIGIKHYKSDNKANFLNL